MAVKHLDDFQGTERFAIRRRLGAGGMGVVYEAFDQDRQQRVALKTIQNLNGSSLYRFKNEFRNLADLAHPNLVRLFELFSEGDQWFFTMELVEGEDFLDFVCPDHVIPEDDPLTHQSDSLDAPTWPLAAGPSDPAKTEASPSASPEAVPEPPLTEALTAAEATQADTSDADPAGTETETDLAISLPPSVDSPSPDPSTTVSMEPTSLADSLSGSAEVGQINKATWRPPHLVRLKAALRQIAEVLNELHAQGRLHRDIKPSNVLVTRRGRVVLLDFGLATDFADQLDPMTTEGRVVGTVAYMAPEQAAGQPLGPSSDWYNVGVMLYQALTGRLPFTGKSLAVMLAKQSEEPPPPGTINPAVPADLDDLCFDLLRRRPEDRPDGEEVLRRLGSTPAGAVRLGSRSRPFVGRAGPLAALGESFETLRQGRPVAAFVHGRSGVGKSACVQRFLDGLTERGAAVVLAGRCYEQESVAYKALDSLIDALSRHLKRLGRLEVEALLPRDVTALARVFPVLRRIDAVAEAPRRAAEIPDQQELRRRAFAALREMLARIGDRKPLILQIDDLQWGDLDSAALLTDLLRPPDPPVLMLLCAYRREDVAASACLRALLDAADDVPVLADRRDVPIEPLLPEEGRELALALIGQGSPAAQDVARMIVGEAGGSPYFVYELVQYLKEGGDLADGDSLANSSTICLDTVLRRRIQKLPREARELLEVLAVAGQPLRQAVACRAAGQGADGFAALAMLRSQHLIRGTGPGMLDDVESYHDRIRETVIHHLEPSRKAHWQAGLARELEATGDADPEILALHFEGAGDPVRAGEYYGRAADEAAESLAFDHAAKLYRRALALRPTGDIAENRPLHARLGAALANSGRSLEAAREYQQAAVGAGSEDLLELQRRAAYQFFCSGHIDDGMAAIRVVLDRVGLRMPATPGNALVRVMIERLLLRLRGLRFRERIEAAIPSAERTKLDASMAVALGISNVDVIRGAYFQTQSLRLALRAGEPVRIARSLAWEAVHAACNGLPGHRRTAKLIRTADALARRLDDPQALGMVDLARSASDFLEGRFATSIAHGDRAQAIFRERCTGVAWERTTTDLYVLWSHFYAGRLADLRERLALAVKEARDRGDLYLEVTLLPYLGAIVLLADDAPDAAAAQADAVIAQWTQEGFHVQHLDHYYAHHYIHLYRGDGPAAWRLVREKSAILKGSLLPRIQQVRTDLIQLNGRAAVAAAAATPDDRPALLKAAEEAARRLDRERAAWGLAMAALIRAGAAAIIGNRETAADRLRNAVDGFAAVPMDHYHAACQRQLGLLIGGDAGRDHVAEADAWMHSQGVIDPARMADCLAPGFSR